MSDRDWQLEYETQKHRANAAEKERIAVRGELKEVTEALREVRGALIAAAAEMVRIGIGIESLGVVSECFEDGKLSRNEGRRIANRLRDASYEAKKAVDRSRGALAADGKESSDGS